jgi:uncharacterized protein
MSTSAIPVDQPGGTLGFARDAGIRCGKAISKGGQGMRLIMIALGIVLAGLARPGNAAEMQIAILTSTPSGIWYPLGMTLSSIYGNAISGARVTVQATAGSVENLRLMENGNGELAFTLGSTLENAWAGNKASGFNRPLTKLRAIARIYPNYMEFVASKQSGVKTIADMKGKRVSVGPEGSGSALDAAQVFKAAGFTPADLANVVHEPFGPSFRMVSQGKLDAAMITGGLGIELVRHLLASMRATLVSIPPEIISKIGDKAYVAATVPARTYDGQPAAVPTAAVPNFLVTREGVTDAAAYLMTKSLFEHLDQLVETDPAAKGIDIKEATVGVPIPLHPGAERYYREIGILK